MARFPALLVVRITTLVALAASAALAVEYRTDDFAYCGAESGCAAVRHTPLAYMWGYGPSLPELGLLAFSGLFALSLTRRGTLTACIALVAGVCGLALIGAQAFWLHHFCWLCTTTDLSALVGAGAALALLRTPPEARVRTPLAAWRWAALAAIAVVAPTFWPELRPLPKVPSTIRAYYVPSKVNVVEFADFECPFCRELHARLHALLATYGAKAHFVRLNMPLERHSHARDAALAALCAEASGKADAIAEFLFTTEDLSVAAIRDGAAKLGIELSGFDACRAAPATAARLEREMAVLKDAGFQGLPTTYVGGRRIVGAQSDDTFRAAMAHAAAGDDERGIPGWAFIAFVLALVAAIVRTDNSSAARSAERATERGAA